jgi:predicted small lipoprotein YifL
MRLLEFPDKEKEAAAGYGHQGRSQQEEESRHDEVAPAALLPDADSENHFNETDAQNEQDATENNESDVVRKMSMHPAELTTSKNLHQPASTASQ